MDNTKKFELILPLELQGGIVKNFTSSIVVKLGGNKKKIKKVKEWMSSNKISFTMDEFQPSEGIISRYATKKVNPQYYGVVRVDGIDTSEID